MGQTIIDKLWAEHTVADLGDGATLLYIDRIFLPGCCEHSNISIR